MSKLQSDASGFLIGEVLNLPNAKQINHNLSSIKKDISLISKNLSLIAKNLNSNQTKPLIYQRQENLNQNQKAKNEIVLIAAKNQAKAKNQTKKEQIKSNLKTAKSSHKPTALLNTNRKQFANKAQLSPLIFANKTLEDPKQKRQKKKNTISPYYQLQTSLTEPKSPAKTLAAPNKKTHSKQQKRSQSLPPPLDLPPSNTPKRDHKGRFIAKNKQQTPNNQKLDYEKNEAKNDNLKQASQILANSVIDTANDLSQNDAAIIALKELISPFKKIFSGVNSAFNLIFGGDKKEDQQTKQNKKQTRFLRDILSKINFLNRAQTKFNKAAQKSLKEIENKPIAKNNRSFLGSFLPKTLLFSSLAGGGLLGGLFGKIGKIGGKIARKTPFLAGLFNLGENLSKIFKSLKSNQTKEQKSLTIGKSSGNFVGSVGGMIGGAKLGALVGSFIPVFGTAIGGIIGGALGYLGGGYLGELIGEKCAAVFNQIDFKALQSNILTAWHNTLDLFSATWQNVQNAAISAFDGAVGFFGKAKNELKTLGANVKDIAGEAVDGAVGFFGKAKNELKTLGANVKDIAGEAAEGVVGFFGKAKNELKTLGVNVKDIAGEKLGFISAKFESSKGGYAAVSSGKGDNGGASYGKYQLSSKAGTLAKFLQQSGYAGEFAGLEVGSTAFKQKWQNLATNPNFNKAQDDFIEQTHYAPMVKSLAKSGVDLSQKGRAVKEALFSTSVQFGAKKGGDLVKGALKNKDVNALNDAQIISLIQDYKAANNQTLFKSSDAATKAATFKRAFAEKSDLLKLASNSFMPPKTKAPLAFAPNLNLPTGVTPNLHLAQKIENPPPLLMPLNSKDNKPIVKVILPNNNLSQDVPDRTIAHVINGGLTSF